jgi:hypothetical protein
MRKPTIYEALKAKLGAGDRAMSFRPEVIADGCGAR